MEEIARQEDEMKDLRQKLNDVEAEINKVGYSFNSFGKERLECSTVVPKPRLLLVFKLVKVTPLIFIKDRGLILII